MTRTMPYKLYGKVKDRVTGFTKDFFGNALFTLNRGGETELVFCDAEGRIFYDDKTRVWKSYYDDGERAIEFELFTEIEKYAAEKIPGGAAKVYVCCTNRQIKLIARYLLYLQTEDPRFVTLAEFDKEKPVDPFGE
jgi:hypothetical protein